LGNKDNNKSCFSGIFFALLLDETGTESIIISFFVSKKLFQVNTDAISLFETSAISLK